MLGLLGPLMPISGLVRRASKIKSKVPTSKRSGEFNCTDPHDVLNQTSRHLETSFDDKTMNVTCSQEQDPVRTMQLSLDASRSVDSLPSYPFADSIALVLILVNFPNLLMMATHLLFSVKEHVGANSSGSTIISPPLFMILFIDAVVVLFITLLLPSLRSIVTDMSHVIIAISMTGASWQDIVPLSFIISTTRGCFHKLSSYLDHCGGGGDGDGGIGGGTMMHMVYARLTKPLCNGASRLDASTNSQMIYYVKSAAAIHIFSLGLIRYANYWLHRLRSDGREQDHDQAMAKTKYKSDGHKSEFVSLPSIWDWFLRWRAEVSGKRHELTHTIAHSDLHTLSISGIASRCVVFALQTNEADEPSLDIKVNGLVWKGKVSRLQVEPSDKSELSSKVTQHSWLISVENLSPKVEYEVLVLMKTATNDTLSFSFSVCTSPSSNQAGRDRGDNCSASAIDNNAIEDQTMSHEILSCPVDRLSPVSDLEDTVSKTSSTLEEKRSTLKRTRKENVKRIQVLQKELDHLSSRLNSGIDKNEQRAQGRMLSLQTEIRRMQDTIEEMEAEKEDIIRLTAEQLEQWTTKKQERDHEAQLLESMRRTYDAEKAKHSKRFTTVEAESARLRGKADKLSMRRTKIQQDLDRISSEQNGVLDREMKERAANRETLNHHRLQIEAELLKSILDLSQRAELLELYS